MDRARPSVLTWFVLGAALLGVSSGGALLQAFDAVPPLLRASWRLQATTVLLLPLGIDGLPLWVKNIRQKPFERS